MGATISLIGIGLFAYLFGSTPFGFLIGKFNGIDIRRVGSGNIGATNIRRALGRDWGILCFALDLLKGLLPVLICQTIAKNWSIGGETAGLIAALMTVTGHMWPCWLKFRGGKGVSTTIGTLFAIAPVAVLCALVVWLIVFLTARYVSLASVCSAVTMPLAHAIHCPFRSRPILSPTLLLLAILATLIVARHRGNLKRLLEGTEYRFGTKGKRS